MYQINFNKPCHIYFMGIGGISMSGLAQVLVRRGFTVMGSDVKESPLTKQLEEQGCTIHYGQRADNITADIDIVVYTAAIHADNPELVAAKEANIPLLSRAELLGQILDHFANSVAVAGTHGKTTTTSMIAQILIDAGSDPTISVGGILDVIGGNIKVGHSDIFVTEACEYTNSFLNLNPKFSIILNIEEDHLDFFKDLADIRHSFQKFIAQTADDGIVFLNGSIEDPNTLTADTKAQVVTYGIDSTNDYHATDITYDELGHATFTLVAHGQSLGTISLSVPGSHNIENALAAAALSLSLGLSFQEIAAGLKHFTGTKRRFELKGRLGKITIVDDYAHHPTEITATLNAAAKCKVARIVCVFQPHTYTRTKSFLDDFAKALSKADLVILPPIYAARETDTLGISSKDLRDRIEALGTPAYYFSSFDEIENFLLKNCMNSDLLITMGAGDVVKIGEHLLGQ
ncbi:UDP-N-acetylmuramate--L-alanine ligase [Eubacterium oxidoreducens]|uniref:UDP-N-acetylmuramate--L-alanine ligase n=1 Tax=Eubacterium oxidoreducens TaxID=1732 RepID=A0A1G6BW14_EUBOX|nr:UDP-N-acetylmuramate--L-alanine ligase [Eubacterium oxidoreducens]SDB24774.1 UDP-N-acetylmuramate--L-alanine ligase [Eubacterium oxidoreducens]